MTAGRNKGKQYAKLKGYEEATPESEERANEFMQWYGDNFNRLRDKLIFTHLYDDEVATDTALIVYDNIALKRFVVVDYQAYFLRAYHTNRVAKLKRRVYETELAQLQDEPFIADLDHEEREEAVDRLNNEMLEYVRASYDPFSTSLFEIYIGLLPDTSYKRLAALLGLPDSQVWTRIGVIRKDLAQRFKGVLSLD